jgi:hypothetical protein
MIGKMFLELKKIITVESEKACREREVTKIIEIFFFKRGN